MNWVSLDIDDLKAVAFGGVVDAAQTTATGTHDPAAEAIADAVADVRGAISTVNVLDADVAKVPRSLRALAARSAVFALMERVGMDLSIDQRATRQADLLRLQRIGEQKQRFEQADAPAGAAEMEPGLSVEAVAGGKWGDGEGEGEVGGEKFA